MTKRCDRAATSSLADSSLADDPRPLALDAQRRDGALRPGQEPELASAPAYRTTDLRTRTARKKPEMATTDTGKSNPYLSLAEASEYLGQSVKTLRRRIAAGILPAYRFGPRMIRVRLRDLEATAQRIPNARTPGDHKPLGHGGASLDPKAHPSRD